MVLVLVLVPVLVLSPRNDSGCCRGKSVVVLPGASVAGALWTRRAVATSCDSFVPEVYISSLESKQIEDTEDTEDNAGQKIKGNIERL